MNSRHDDDGPAAVEQLPGVKQIDRNQIVKDICALIRVMPLTKRQVQALYGAVWLRVQEQEKNASSGE